MIAINYANPDKSKVARNIIVSVNYRLKQIMEYIEGKEDEMENDWK